MFTHNKLLVLNCLALTTLTSISSAQWPARWNPSGSAREEGKVVAVEHSGNVFVAGISTHSGRSDLDFQVIKYDAAGYFQWARNYDGDANGDDIGTGLVVDWQGNCYICGVSDNGSHSKFAVVKYAPNGDLVWPSSGSGGSGAGAYEFDNGAIQLNDSNSDGIGHFAGEGAICAIGIENVAGSQPTFAITGPSTSGTYNRWRTVVFEDDGFGAVQIKSGWPVDESTSVEDEDQSYAVAISSADHTVFMTGGQVLPLDNLRTKDA